jgi:hypothetical protein
MKICLKKFQTLGKFSMERLEEHDRKIQIFVGLQKLSNIC